MRKLILISLYASLLLFSGCITIFEKYKINADGSGSLEYIIDMSEMYEMMAAFSDSTEEMEMGDFEDSMKELLPGLNSISGISNAELTGDVSKYISGIKFDFQNSEALNNAMALLFTDGDSQTEKVKYVEIKGKTFTRFGYTSSEFNKDELLGSEELDEETMTSLLESMKYNISVNFERTVKKVKKEKKDQLEDNTVTIEANFSQIFDKPDYLQTIIKTR